MNLQSRGHEATPILRLLANHRSFPMLTHHMFQNDPLATPVSDASELQGDAHSSRSTIVFHSFYLSFVHLLAHSMPPVRQESRVGSVKETCLK